MLISLLVVASYGKHSAAEFIDVFVENIYHHRFILFRG